MNNVKTWERYSIQSLTAGNTSSSGMMFASDAGMKDLSSILICGHSVDTVRQLVKGIPSKFALQTLHQLTEDGKVILDKATHDQGAYIGFRSWGIPCDLVCSRMGKTSGYRYRLQNAEHGIVILLGSYYQKTDVEHTHLKIELSPHYLKRRSPQTIDKDMQDIAAMFLEKGHSMTGCAVHLAVDFQGFDIPDHMVDHLTTRSRAIRQYNGIDAIKFEGLDGVASVYGRTETLMLGKASSLQTCIYRKDLEIIKSDKVDYFHDFWGRYTLGEHNPDAPTVRVEFRFHHNVINQFGETLKKDLTTFSAVSEHLTDLFRYGLQNCRYMYDKTHIHPLWQLLHEDIQFLHPACDDALFKRTYTKNDTSAIAHNIAIALGNLLSIYARTPLHIDQIREEIEQLSIYEHIQAWNVKRNKSDAWFWAAFHKRLKERRLASKFARVA